MSPLNLAVRRSHNVQAFEYLLSADIESNRIPEESEAPVDRFRLVVKRSKYSSALMDHPEALS
jgi:hypothetical protein